MPEMTMISRTYVDEIFATIAGNEPELIAVGEQIVRRGAQYITDATAALGGGRYAVVMPDDLEFWPDALERLDAVAPGTGEWYVVESESYGYALVSYLERM